jgi:outer membrane receptor protein involved in Fe transport
MPLSEAFSQEEFKGQVKDAVSGKPLPFASIAIKKTGSSSTPLGGGIADTSGYFSFDMPKGSPLLLQISAVGYTSLIDTLFDDWKTFNGRTYSLTASAKSISEYNLTEDRPEMELGVDRKIFNVQKNSIAAGGSALDALRQVPLAQVDVDGAITVRGSGSLLVYINGKPSGLNAENRSRILEQIPASSIVRFELITSPSAKYDAEGVSILNIITKEDRPDGRFGQLSAGGGWPANSNASASFNIKKGAWVLANSLSFRSSTRPMSGFTRRNTYLPGTSFLRQDQVVQGDRSDMNASMSGSIEFSPNKKNTITLTYLGGPRQESHPEEFRNTFSDSLFNPSKHYLRKVDNLEQGWNSDIGLAWNKKGKENGSEWNASISSSINGEHEQGDFLQYDSIPVFDTLLSRSINRSINGVLTAQIDRTQILKPKALSKLEFGLKSNLRRSDNNLQTDSLSATTGWFSDTLRTGAFRYDEWVAAAYVQVAGKIYKNLDYQAGLRSEFTMANGYISTDIVAFNKRYIQFFPTANLKWSPKNGLDFTLGYSRRIDRPGFWSLNPFPDYRDPFNVRQGNPNLNPELTDALELSFSKMLGPHFLYASAYYRYVDGPIQRLISIDSIGIATVAQANFGYSHSTGLEMVYRARIKKVISGTFTLNLFRTYTAGNSSFGALDAENYSLNLRSQWTYKMGKTWEWQASIFYQAPQVFPQGEISYFLWVDAGLRKDFLDGKLSLAINASDIFDTRRFLFKSRDIYFDGEVLRDPMTVRFTGQLTWKFGKPFKAEQRGRRRNEGIGGGEDMGM